jgi:hypothetical protein
MAYILYDTLLLTMPRHPFPAFSANGLLLSISLATARITRGWGLCSSPSTSLTGRERAENRGTQGKPRYGNGPRRFNLRFLDTFEDRYLDVQGYLALKRSTRGIVSRQPCEWQLVADVCCPRSNLRRQRIVKKNDQVSNVILSRCQQVTGPFSISNYLERYHKHDLDNGCAEVCSTR